MSKNQLFIKTFLCCSDNCYLVEPAQPIITDHFSHRFGSHPASSAGYVFNITLLQLKPLSHRA